MIVVEVMGRYAGWIALHAGVAGGADVILIPEIPYDLDKVAQHHPCARGARRTVQHRSRSRRSDSRRRPAIPSANRVPPRLRSALAALASGSSMDLGRKTNKEMRSVMLGHLQRGGVPTSADRLLATRFGARALELVLEQKWGTMVALQPPDIVAVPLAKVVDRVRTVPPDCDLIRAARAVGVAFGN